MAAKKLASKKTKAIVALADIPMMHTPMRSSKEDRARERRYQAEDALRTIARAEEHKANPSLMKTVKKIAAEHVRSMAKIAK
jgi:hypothetical protein